VVSDEQTHILVDSVARRLRGCITLGARHGRTVIMTNYDEMPLPQSADTTKPAELERLRGAASYLESKGAQLVLFRPQRECEHATEREIACSYDLMPEDIIEAAIDQGWEPSK
jgi:hypothetical protein